MKRWIQVVLGGSLVGLIIICSIYIYSVSRSPIPRPVGSQAGDAHRLCAAAWCQSWETYTTTLDTSSLIHFYEAKGFQCTQIRVPYDAGQFSIFSLPYWQCAIKRPAQGAIYIGFQGSNVDGAMSVRIYASWDPNECGATRIC